MDSLRRNLLDAKKLWRCATMTRALGFGAKTGDWFLVILIWIQRQQNSQHFSQIHNSVSHFVCLRVSLSVCLSVWPRGLWLTAFVVDHRNEFLSFEDNGLMVDCCLVFDR